MYRSKKLAPSKRTLLVSLALLSLLILLLPHRWTGGLISLVQVIVPFQDAARQTAESLRSSLHGEPDRVSGAAHEALAKQKAALEHQVAALSVRVAELEEDVNLLKGTRLWEVDGERIGARGRLVPGKVITSDLLPWRSSRLVDTGTLQGVRAGAPVVSAHFTIDRGAAHGVKSGMAIVLREMLVGFIEQSGTHTSHVKLLCDPSVEMKVRIGRFTDGDFALVDRYFWLRGRGEGIMEIRDVESRRVDDGLIQIGDVVLSASRGDTAGLPAAMRVGDVIDIRRDRDNPLLSILTIKSPILDDHLSRIYVYVAENDPGAPG